MGNEYNKYRLSIVLNKEQREAVDKAVAIKGGKNKQRIYRMALSAFCKDQGVTFPNDLRSWSKDD